MSVEILSAAAQLNEKSHLIALSYGIKISPVGSLDWISHKARVTDGQMERRTEL